MQPLLVSMFKSYSLVGNWLILTPHDMDELKINLDDFVGCKNGKLTYDGTNFSRMVKKVKLEVNEGATLTLVAECGSSNNCLVRKRNVLLLTEALLGPDHNGASHTEEVDVEQQWMDLTWVTRHDIWNIFSLPVTCALNICYIFYNGGEPGSSLATAAAISSVAVKEARWYGRKTATTAAVAAASTVAVAQKTDEFLYYLQFCVFLAYIILDLLFVAFKPRCVGAPGTVLMHHCITIAGWCFPMFLPSLRKGCAIVCLVEVNTWFKFVRRYSPDWLTQPLDLAFIVSWLVIRCGVYPYYFVLMIQEWHRYTRDECDGKAWNSASLAAVLLGTLCTLNLHWTIELFSKRSYLGMSAMTKAKTENNK